MKIYVGFFIIALAGGYAVADYLPEQPCVNAGGVCVNKAFCPNSPYESGLCPEQQKHGVECCYPLQERPCRSVGGECAYDCPPKIVSSTPCHEGKQCCIYLN